MGTGTVSTTARKPELAPILYQRYLGTIMNAVNKKEPQDQLVSYACPNQALERLSAQPQQVHLLLHPAMVGFCLASRSMFDQ